MTNIGKIELPDFEKLLSDVITIPSVSSPQPHWDQSNQGVIDLLTIWFEKLGFKCEHLVSDSSNQKVNLIATLGEGPPGIILSGHSDTVPFDDNLWLSDPFSLRVEQGRAFGLGVCDMKGFFPIIIEALRQLEQASMTRSLVVFATADEESTMNGVRSLVESYGQKAEALLIGEPTDLRAIRMHKGMMMQKIEIVGRSGHSSNPGLGRNAIDVMHDVLSGLKSLRKSWMERYQVDGFGVPYPTMNFGHVCGGDSPNRICGKCELSLDVRPVPGMSLQDTKLEIEACLQPFVALGEINIVLHDLMDAIPPFEQRVESDLVQHCEMITGKDSGTVAFATEAPFLQNLAKQTIVMGAGSIDQAHQPNEFLDLGHVPKMAGYLRALIQRYCISAK